MPTVGNHLAGGVSDKRPSPKLNMLFTSDSIDCRNINTVGSCMSKLCVLPHFFPVAGDVFFYTFIDFSNRRWVKENLRSFECGNPCSFGKPLIKADQNRDFSK